MTKNDSMTDKIESTNCKRKTNTQLKIDHF